MGATATPDDATARRWLRVLAESLSDDPAEIALRLALLIATEAPGALADRTIAELVSGFADIWAARLLELTRQERDAHADALLALAPLIDSLPSGLAKPAVERRWTALADDDDWRGQHSALHTLCLLPAHLDPDPVRGLVASHSEKACKHGLKLARMLGERNLDTYVDLARLIQRLPPMAGMAVLAAFARGGTEYSFKRSPAHLPAEDDIPRIVAKTLTSHQDWVRELAGVVLVRWRGRLPLPVIADALRDLDAKVRPLAAWLLRHVGGGRRHCALARVPR